MRSFLSLPRRAPPASTLPLTCSPWVARGGWAPRPVVVVVGVIFLTKPPLRPLLPDTHDASSFRSSPALGKPNCLVPEPPLPSQASQTLNVCGLKRLRHPGNAEEENNV